MTTAVQKPALAGINSRITHQSCPKCGTRYPAENDYLGCPSCWSDHGSNLVLQYSDVDARTFRAEATGPRGQWRSRALMPVDAAEIVSLGEGDTPLLRCERSGEVLGVAGLYVKDESQNPTWSFKDRLASAGVSWARALGRPGVVVSSTGNAGASAAAYAARAGLPCLVMSAPDSGGPMQRFMASYGALVIATSEATDRWALNRAVVERLGWLPLSNTTLPTVGSHPAAVDGCKSIAYEIAEDLDWRSPDFVVIPTAYGDCLAGIYRGFEELYGMGLVDTVPCLIAAETSGSLDNALKADAASPVSAPAPDSLGASINVIQSTSQALDAIRATNGAAFTVEDESAWDARRVLAERDGLFVEFSTAVGAAALAQLRSHPAFTEDATVVLIGTSSGLKDVNLRDVRAPDIPTIEPNFDALVQGVASTYGVKL